jgi:hypothetical protein
MISVVNRKLITSDESFLTRAPMTPKDVSLRYSKGRDFEVVLRKGYRNSGMWAIRNVSNLNLLAEAKQLPLRKSARVSLCDATHCRRARALQTRLDAAAVSCDGFSKV